MFQPFDIADFFGLAGGLPAVHGGADAGGGLVGLIDKLLDSASHGVEPGGSFTWMPGLQTLGANLHPLLVHFPIAFLSVFYLLEWPGLLLKRQKLRQAAEAMLYCGTIGAVLAVAAGLYAASFAPHGQVVHEIMEWHAGIGIAVASLAAILSAWRLLVRREMDGMERAFFLFLASLMAIGVGFGADLGGLMVYQHGVAVQSLQAPDAHHQHASTP